MAHSMPKLLFRAWSGDSRGVNSQTLFKPAAHCDQNSTERGDTTPESIEDCGAKLERAVLWKKNTSFSPFIFFSASLLFVLQFAYRMKAQGQRTSTSLPSTRKRLQQLMGRQQSSTLSIHFCPNSASKSGTEVTDQGDCTVTSTRQ